MGKKLLFTFYCVGLFFCFATPLKGMNPSDHPKSNSIELKDLPGISDLTKELLLEIFEGCTILSLTEEDLDKAKKILLDFMPTKQTVNIFIIYKDKQRLLKSRSDALAFFSDATAFSLDNKPKPPDSSSENLPDNPIETHSTFSTLDVDARIMQFTCFGLIFAGVTGLVLLWVGGVVAAAIVCG